MTQEVLRMRYSKVNFSLIAPAKPKTEDLIDGLVVQGFGIGEEEVVVMAKIALYLGIAHMGDRAKFAMVVQIGQIEGVVPKVALKSEIGPIAIFEISIIVAILHEDVVPTPIELVSQQEVFVVEQEGIVGLVACKVVGGQLQASTHIQIPHRIGAETILRLHTDIGKSLFEIVVEVKSRDGEIEIALIEGETGEHIPLLKMDSIAILGIQKLHIVLISPRLDQLLDTTPIPIYKITKRCIGTAIQSVRYPIEILIAIFGQKGQR